MGRKRLAKNKGFPPNLYQNTAGYFYFINPQNKKPKGLGRDKAHAFSEARAANAVLATMRPTPLADWVAGKTDYTLTDWVPVYKELWIGQKPLAASTLRNQAAYLTRIAVADFAWMRMSEIETAHAARFLADVEMESGASTARLMRTRLRDVFRMAETQGVIKSGTNPVAATYAPVSKVKRERLTIEQFLAIRELAPLWLKRAMNVALLTAQRLGDITAMKFADYKGGYLHVVQGKSQGNMRMQQDAKISLGALGMSIGDAVKDCRDMIASRHMIHHTEHQGRAKPGDKVTSNGMSTAFKNARIAAGVEAAEGRTPPSFHEIRSLAERLYRDQYGAAFAQAMLGHKSSAMTDRYDDMRGQGWKVVTLNKNGENNGKTTI